MNTKQRLMTLVLAAALIGCGKHHPRYFVVLSDVSGSIERESLEQAFKAIDEMAGHLQRGDKLTIIPISGDAEAEASGNIMRFEVPATRQAYDMDLKHFRTALTASLKEMQANALVHPGKNTDILGTISIAGHELKNCDVYKRCELIVLSDLIEEDSVLNFNTDPRLSTTAGSTTLADEIVRQEPAHLTGVQVCLGLLRSDEYARLGKQRRDAIKAFWITYFQHLGSQATVMPDGLGILAQVSEK
jgi:hypothetical protein